MHLKFLRAPAALATTLLVSCAALADYKVDILEPGSPMARESYGLHWGIMYVCIAIFFIVFGAMFWSIFKHRRSKGARAAQFHENTTIEVIWTIVPFVVLIGIAYPATRTVIEMKDVSGSDMAVKVTAYQWRWEYDYQNEGIKFISNLATPRDQIDNYDGPGQPKNDNYLLEVDRPLVVPVHKKVRLLITSGDVIHGWYVPQLGVNQYGIPGFVKDAWFEADKPGVYRGQCSQICGKEHAYMPIVVMAKSAEDYAAWVKEQKAKMAPPTPEAVPQQAAAPTSPVAGEQMAAAKQAGKGEALAGRTAAAQVSPSAPAGGAKMSVADLKAGGEKVYLANCAACHQPNGKGIPGTFKPIAGSPTANGPAAAHIATVLKGRPGTAMASWARLSDKELAEVITYERSAFGNHGGAVQPADIAAARKAP